MTIDDSKEVLVSPYILFSLCLSLFAIGLLGAESVLSLHPETRTIFEYLDFVICLFFMADFVASLYKAEDRAKYFIKWGWIDLLSSIPSVDILRLGRAARIMRILRVLRGIRATKILSQFLLNRRAEGAALAAALVTLLLIVIASISILHFETLPESNIKSAEDALWWAVTTVTTVGYGDTYPVTTEGRMIAALLMTAGVGLFGTFSGFVASWFLKPSEEHTHSDIKELQEEIRLLREILKKS